MRKLTLALFLITFGFSCLAQQVCPEKKDSILPGMLEDLCPIDKNLISFKTYYLSERFKLTEDESQAIYSFKIPEYKQSGASKLVPKFKKSVGHSPMIKPGMTELQGEIIYKKNGSLYHVSFERGVLWSITEEDADDGNWLSYTDLSLLLDENPQWIRSETYNREGQVDKIKYWYYCGDEIVQQGWKKYY